VTDPLDWRDVPEVPASRSRRGEATRQRIIEAAADLFAERGIDGVELAEILAAADQHNASAIQYHFGSRTGLIVAVLQPRPEIRGPLEAARLDAIERLLIDGRPVTLGDAVEALVRPMFATLRSHAGRSWLRVAAQVLRKLPMENRTDTIGGASARLFALIASRMPEMPEPARRERLATATTLAVEMTANRAREIEAGVPHNLGDEDFQGEVRAMLVGLLGAPARVRER
jgi:TetR/AcrR family transcriptional regulator, regulator of cefoperazone and chloramphenicol sensitivity